MRRSRIVASGLGMTRVHLQSFFYVPFAMCKCRDNYTEIGIIGVSERERDIHKCNHNSELGYTHNLQHIRIMGRLPSVRSRKRDLHFYTDWSKVEKRKKKKITKNVRKKTQIAKNALKKRGEKSTKTRCLDPFLALFHDF
jgi:hypothetical protein